MRFSLSRGIIALPIRAWVEEYTPPSSPRDAYCVCGDYAVVSISGPLEQKSGAGFDCYPNIYARVLAACQSVAPAVCLKLDSPGGDFSGCLELSREIAALCETHNKKLIAFTDSSALSAAYALACAADEIVITESAFVGSVGVWAALVDMTAADRAMGQNIVIVPSGSRKADRNPHVAITEATVEAMQAQVDSMASLFFNVVSERRGISVDSVKAIQGAEVFGQAAITARLANRIVGSWNAFIAERVTTMSKYADAMAALKAAAEGDDEDAEMAKKALKAMAPEEEDKKEEKASAASEDTEKDEDEDKKKMKKAKSEKEVTEEKEAKAAALSPSAFKSPTNLELAAEIQSLRAERAQEKEAIERAALLSKRPDFAADIRASLADAPIDFVRKAVATWARIPVTSTSSKALTPNATRGESQLSHDNVVNDEESDLIDIKMGLKSASHGIKHKHGGREVEFGFMSPDDVLKALAAKNGVK